MRRLTSRQMALLAGALLLPLSAGVYVRSRMRDPRLPEEIHRRLFTNRQALDLSDGGAHFDASLIDAQGKRIFLLGESHGVAINEDLDLALFRYLHRTAGVRVYFSEISYAQACLLNRYLETGDEELLDFLFGEFRNTSFRTREHREFIHKLRAWNASLDRRNRIRMVGVDVEHQPRIAMRFLSDLVAAASREVPGDIAATVARLDGFRDSPSVTASGFAPELVSSIERHTAEYSDLLGDRLLDFEIVATNLQNGAEFYGNRDRRKAGAIREQAMYDTFRRLYPSFAGEVCYGRWGADHIIQRQFQGHEPFAAMLNRPESPVAGQIISIQPIYQHSHGTVSSGETYRDYDASAPAPFLEPFAPLAMGSVTMFRIREASSLLARELPGYPLGEGVQYVVLIRDAEAAHPLGESMAPP
jgi:Erythromycin esterase